jgi:hypothetical protein
VFQLEKLRSKREDTDFGRKKVYYIDDIRVISGIDPECLSGEELHETKKAAEEALDRIDKLRERNEPDRSNWPLYGVLAILILFLYVGPLPFITSQILFGLMIVALLTALYPLMKLLFTQRFMSIEIKLNEIFIECTIELSKRDD